MTDERDQIIAAGAKAEWAHTHAVYRERGMRPPLEWDELPPQVVAEFMRRTATRYDAMVLLIRQQTAEEIAQRLAIKVVRYTAHTMIGRTDKESGYLSALRDAAAIAREVGARPLDQEGTRP